MKVYHTKNLLSGVVWAFLLLPSIVDAGTPSSSRGVPTEERVGSRSFGEGIRVPPDELTLNLGAIDNVGTNVTVVLKKRSIRSDGYLCGIWTDNGFEKITYPVRTYRGYVEGDPSLRVNGSIAPGNLFSGAFSEGRLSRARITDVKVEVGTGQATPHTGTRNREVPLDQVAARHSPTPGGYFVPQHPMRRDRWTVVIPADAAYLKGEGGLAALRERAVAVVEQRFNNGDFVYARDAGAAWEIQTLVIVTTNTTRDIDWGVICPDDPRRRQNTKLANMHGNKGPNACQKGQIWVGHVRPCGDILLHEAGHSYGLAHHLDQDCMYGGAFHVGPNNLQVICRNVRKGGWINETNFPAVVYGDVLPPYAMDDVANTAQDTPITVDVLENDYDGNGDTITLQSVTPRSAKGGAVKVTPDNRQARYTPPAGFIGQDTFGYTVVDGTGVGNRTGVVKVDVRAEGLAAWFSFDEPQMDGPGENSPDLACRFPNHGPYGAGGSMLWMDYRPVQGVRGNGLYNPAGGSVRAQVQFSDIGDPGRQSLGVSLWVLYPKPIEQDGVILSKGALAYSKAIDWVVNGWAIAHRKGGGFKFTGNVARLQEDEAFDLESEALIQPNKWYHLVMVIDRQTKKLRAWVNNEEVLTSRNTAAIAEGAIVSYAPMTLFNGFSNTRWNSSPMLVDELKIFTSVLTSEQVAELYAEGKAAKVPELTETTAEK